MANIVPHYNREVRVPDTPVCIEMGIPEGDDFVYTLISQGESFAQCVVAGDTVMGAMPGGWAPPPDPWALIREYEKGGNAVLLVARNVVTFVTHMDDGRLQLQLRSFVSPEGKAIGNPGMFSLNGGLMESDDIGEEVAREALEELGVFTLGFQTKVGDVYDADKGRTNHVFRFTQGYETFLRRIDELKDQLQGHDAIAALTNPEGIGRAFVWRGDLDALIAAGRLTPISATILGKFPSLLPPPRPASVSKAA